MAALPTSCVGNLQLRWDRVTAPAAGTSVGVASPPCHCTAPSRRAGLAVGVTPLDVPVGAPQRGSCPLPGCCTCPRRGHLLVLFSPGRRCSFHLSENSGRSKTFSGGSLRAVSPPDRIKARGSALSAASHPTVGSFLGWDVPGFIHTDPRGRCLLICPPGHPGQSTCIVCVGSSLDLPRQCWGSQLPLKRSSAPRRAGTRSQGMRRQHPLRLVPCTSPGTSCHPCRGGGMKDHG